jgi:dipeptide/tripeptide permease
MALGLFLLALSYLVMALAAYVAPQGGSSWLWLFVFFVFITLGELYLSPIGLALVARVAPPQILSMMMGLWFITSFTGNLLQGRYLDLQLPAQANPGAKGAYPSARTCRTTSRSAHRTRTGGMIFARRAE